MWMRQPFEATFALLGVGGRASCCSGVEDDIGVMRRISLPPVQSSSYILVSGSIPIRQQVGKKLSTNETRVRICLLPYSSTTVVRFSSERPQLRCKCNGQRINHTRHARSPTRGHLLPPLHVHVTAHSRGP